jgi:hypothetical protein
VLEVAELDEPANRQILIGLSLPSNTDVVGLRNVPRPPVLGSF